MITLQPYTKDTRSIVLDTIQKYGFSPEHNIFDFENVIDDYSEAFIGVIDDEYIVLTQEDDEKTWWVFADPLAPPKKRGMAIAQFLEYVFSKEDAKRVTCELFSATKDELLDHLPKYLDIEPQENTLIGPIFELEQFDESLGGHQLKKIRSVVRQFNENVKIEARPAQNSPHEDAMGVIHRWIHNRTFKDEVFIEYYQRFVESNFEGAEETRVLYVNNKPVALNGGWRVPNSETFYNALSLHDYSLRGLGEIIMVEALSYLKNKGYTYADFGVGEKNLTSFKQKFCKNKLQTAYEFSVVKK
ncbi:MAG: GNAT family N-acetyltransferase [bacterium]|nr:GNAT family N-acetyltransferase [bacterium]